MPRLIDASILECRTVFPSRDPAPPIERAADGCTIRAAERPGVRPRPPPSPIDRTKRTALDDGAAIAGAPIGPNFAFDIADDGALIWLKDNSNGKNATAVKEHGGFNEDDTHVAILLSHPDFDRLSINAAVATTQIAPTILEALGLDPNANHMSRRSALSPLDLNPVAAEFDGRSPCSDMRYRASAISQSRNALTLGRRRARCG